MSTLFDKPHRRLNILTGEWVLVSPHRNKRPWQGSQEKPSLKQSESYDPSCYLCPGNQRASGEVNPQYSSTYSFVNDFAALLPGEGIEEYSSGHLVATEETGMCKVICFSPDHSLTLPLMSVPAITEVVQLWKKEYLELGALPEINHVQIFENKGATMGCSNPHPHGQIWAQRSVPTEPAKKTVSQKEFFQKNNESLLQSYLQQEITAKERIVEENDSFVALVPFWAVWPYEVMVLPRKHYRHIGELSLTEEVHFAEIIKTVTILYDNLFETSFPYSMGIHQAPTDGNQHQGWHFHLSFYPPLLRSATVKKFMVGYEMFANPQRDITAEQAAQQLRNQSFIHYSQL